MTEPEPKRPPPPKSYVPLLLGDEPTPILPPRPHVEGEGPVVPQAQPNSVPSPVPRPRTGSHTIQQRNGSTGERNGSSSPVPVKPERRKNKKAPPPNPAPYVSPVPVKAAEQEQDPGDSRPTSSPSPQPPPRRNTHSGQVQVKSKAPDDTDGPQPTYAPPDVLMDSLYSEVKKPKRYPAPSIPAPPPPAENGEASPKVRKANPTGEPVQPSPAKGGPRPGRPPPSRPSRPPAVSPPPGVTSPAHSRPAPAQPTSPTRSQSGKKRLEITIVSAQPMTGDFIPSPPMSPQYEEPKPSPPFQRRQVPPRRPTHEKNPSSHPPAPNRSPPNAQPPPTRPPPASRPPPPRSPAPKKSPPQKPAPFSANRKAETPKTAPPQPASRPPPPNSAVLKKVPTEALGPPPDEEPPEPPINVEEYEHKIKGQSSDNAEQAPPNEEIATQGSDTPKAAKRKSKFTKVPSEEPAPSADDSVNTSVPKRGPPPRPTSSVTPHVDPKTENSSSVQTATPEPSDTHPKRPPPAKRPPPPKAKESVQATPEKKPTPKRPTSIVRPPPPEPRKSSPKEGAEVPIKVDSRNSSQPTPVERSLPPKAANEPEGNKVTSSSQDTMEEGVASELPNRSPSVSRPPPPRPRVASVAKKEQVVSKKPESSVVEEASKPHRSPSLSRPPPPRPRAASVNKKHEAEVKKDKVTDTHEAKEDKPSRPRPPTIKRPPPPKERPSQAQGSVKEADIGKGKEESLEALPAKKPAPKRPPMARPPPPKADSSQPDEPSAQESSSPTPAARRPHPLKETEKEEAFVSDEVETPSKESPGPKRPPAKRPPPLSTQDQLPPEPQDQQLVEETQEEGASKEQPPVETCEEKDEALESAEHKEESTGTDKTSVPEVTRLAHPPVRPSKPAVARPPPPREVDHKETVEEESSVKDSPAPKRPSVKRPPPLKKVHVESPSEPQIEDEKEAKEGSVELISPPTSPTISIPPPPTEPHPSKTTDKQEHTKDAERKKGEDSIENEVSGAVKPSIARPPPPGRPSRTAVKRPPPPQKAEHTETAKQDEPHTKESPVPKRPSVMRPPPPKKKEPFPAQENEGANMTEENTDTNQSPSVQSPTISPLPEEPVTSEEGVSQEGSEEVQPNSEFEEKATTETSTPAPAKPPHKQPPPPTRKPSVKRPPPPSTKSKEKPTDSEETNKEEHKSHSVVTATTAEVEQLSSTEKPESEEVQASSDSVYNNDEPAVIEVQELVEDEAVVPEKASKLGVKQPPRVSKSTSALTRKPGGSVRRKKDEEEEESGVRIIRYDKKETSFEDPGVILRKKPASKPKPPRPVSMPPERFTPSKKESPELARTSTQKAKPGRPPPLTIQEKPPPPARPKPLPPKTKPAVGPDKPKPPRPGPPPSTRTAPSKPPPPKATTKPAVHKKTPPAKAHDPSRPPPLPPRPVPGHSLYKYVCSEPHGLATAHYEAQAEDELSYYEGDVIELIEKIDKHWYYARNADLDMQEGLVLKRNLKLIKKLPGSNLVEGFEDGPCAVAKHDFNAQSMDELTFSAGDLIMLKARVGKDWLRGKLISGAEGIFPNTYVEIVEDLPADAVDEAPQQATSAQSTVDRRDPHCVALHPFTAEGPDELSISPGDVISLVHREGEWLRGELAGREGIFPADFVDVKVEPPLKQVAPEPAKTQDGPKSVVVTATYDYEGQDGDLSFKAGDKITLLSRVNEEWVCGELAGKKGMLPVSFIDSNPDSLPPHEKKEEKKPSSTMAQTITGECEALFDFDGDVAGGELAFKRGDTITTTEWVSPEWMKGTLGDKTGIFPVNFVKVTKELPPSSSTSTKSSLSKTTHVEDDLMPKGVALFDYSAGNSSEISFKEGDMLYLLARVNSEWYEGENTRTGNLGQFPANYVNVTVPLP